VLKEALYRFADSIISGSARYSALEAFLQREPPSIEGLPFGAAIVTDSSALIEQATDAVRRLGKSHLFIQGPPGAGKTYTGAHIIASLLDQGFRVGVSSNSHKAINNLLGAVEKRAVEKGLRFQGTKKSTQTNPETCFEGDIIEDVFQNGRLHPETDNQKQRLLLRSNVHPDLRPAGIRLVKADYVCQGLQVDV